MKRFFARHLICPLHEWALRRPTFRYLRELEWSQWSAPADLRRLQAEKLAALLQHAKAHVPYYQTLLEPVKLPDLERDPFEVLSRLSPLSKADIRANIQGLVWRDAPGGVFEHNTGGSTGEPLTFYFDRRRQGYDQAARIRTHRWFNVDIGDRELYLWGSRIDLSGTDRLKRVRDWFFNHRLLDAFDMSAGRMDEYLSALERYRPRCLFGYPSSIALLAEHARTRGRRLEPHGLRAVFITGEVCYPHHRKAIAEYFQVPVADCYGSREGGFIAHQCPEGNLHITAENIIVEIIQDGRPVAPGENGEIVLTHLDAYAQPFIRYRTGDRGRLKPGRCPCGRGLPMMDLIQGRATDFLYLPDGTIKHALSIIYPLRELKGVRQFRVTQAEDYATKVSVVPESNPGRITSEAVARCVRDVVGGQVDLEVEFVERIPAIGSGKYRYVMSQATTPGRASGMEVTDG